MSAPAAVPAQVGPIQPTAVVQAGEKSVVQQEPAPQTVSHKFQKLVKKKQSKTKLVKTIWLAGHAATLALGLVYAFYYVIHRSHKSWVSFIAYRLAMVGVMAAYSASIASQFNRKSLPSYKALVCTFNFQYLVLSVVWFFNRSSLFKIFPFLAIATMQLATQFNIKPVLKLSKEIKIAAAYDELLIVLVLLVDTLLMRGTSGYALIIYSGLYWIRILQSEDTRYFLYSIVGKLDSVMSKQKNKNIVEGWEGVKTFLTAKGDRFSAEFLE